MSPGPAGFDYPSPEVIECPFDFYESLRDHDRLYRLPSGEFLVSRYEDVVAVARSPERFSNFIGPINPEIVETYQRSSEEEERSARFSPFPLPFSDPPEHKLKRSLCLSIVSRERLQAYEPLIRRLTDELIDEFIGDGHAEFAAQFAVCLPPSVILHIFGVPPADQPQLTGWLRSEGVGARMLSEQAKHDEGVRRAKARDYFKAMVLERHERPGDDFVSDIVSLKHERDGELDLSYLASEVTNLYIAATSTTAHLLASAMRMLLMHPDQLARLRCDPALIRPMLDEVLRLESPVQWLQRVVTADTELRGTQLPAGSVLLVLWAAANRDPRKFEDPDEFRVDRAHVARDQLGFGHGIHRCIGAALGRLEGRIAYEQLLDRLGELRLAPGADRAPHLQQFNHRAPETVQIEFTPA
jgi:cytochrome P450